MLAEHDHGRGYVKGMADAVAEYKTGNLEAGKKIVENARGYIATLEAHIQKENMALFPSRIPVSRAKRKTAFLKNSSSLKSTKSAWVSTRNSTGS